MAAAAGTAQEEEEEGGEEEEEEGDPLPPIATTPPHRVWREDSLSCSSSETQASVTSGISLGEAIRQKSAANWGTELWYQLPAEVDASCLTAASETKLGLTCDRNDLTDFPTLEEGTLPSAEASSRCSPGDAVHGVVLDTQDTQFPPCLPLLMYSTQGQRFSDEMLLQPSEMDFIPLSGVPDISGVSEERSRPSLTREAVSDAESPSDVPSDCFTLSQHPLPYAHVEPCDASCGGGLSQEPSFSARQDEDCKNDTDEKVSIPQTGDCLANSTSQVVLSEAKGLNPRDAPLAKQTWSPSVKDERFSCDNHILAAGLELLEKEKGLPRHDEFSSSENSSCKSALTKYSAKSEREVPKEKVKMTESEVEGCTRQLEKEKATSELGFLSNLSDDLRKDHCKNSDAQGVFSAKPFETGEGTSREHGVSLNSSESMKFLAVPEGLQGAFQDLQQKQLSPAVRLEKEEFLSPVTSTTPKQLVVTGMEAPTCSENAPVEAEPGPSRGELTNSDFSIERGHKVTGISPSFNLLVGDGSFSGHLAQPNYQSTPGIFLKKNAKVEELGVLVMKSDLQASPSCLKEGTSGNSSASTPVSEKQQSLQYAQKENKEHFEALKSKYPHTGRIQSLPSLNFMEKVQAWNVSQLEMSNALASRDPGGVSLRRKAYSTIACSSSHSLPIQGSRRDPKDSVAASPRVTGTGSLGSLCFPKQDSVLVHPLTRSQSDNAVNVSSRNTSLPEVVLPANSAEAVQPIGEDRDILGVSESISGGSTIQKFTADIILGPSSRDSESTGRRSDLNVLVSGGGVVQLLKEGGNSPNDNQENCDAPENQSRNLNTPPGCVGMDKFDDVSPDSLNLPASLEESSQGKPGSAGCSSVDSRHFSTSVKEDNFIPLKAASLESPVKEELNIEERIPIYLRNLGIDQSPGTILTPFLPRGPIREVEFSPSELRTLKDFTDTGTRATAPPRGDLFSAAEITQTSFNPTTLSVSVSTNSEVGSGILSPCELSPCFSRSFGETPESSCHQLERTALLSTRQEADEPNRWLQDVPSDCSDRRSPTPMSKNLQDLLALNKSKTVNSSLQRWPPGSLAGVKDEMEGDRGPQASSIGQKRSKGQESDSSTEHQTQPELCKLLTESATSKWHEPACSTVSCEETGELSPVPKTMEGVPEDARLGKDSIPQFQKFLLWDQTTTRTSVQEEGLEVELLNYNAGGLRWEKSPDVSLHGSEEKMTVMTRGFRTQGSVGRSEPEGCSNVTTDRKHPGLVGLAQSSGSSEVNTRRSSEVGNPSSSKHLDSVTSVPGGTESILSRASATRSRAGGTQEGSDSRRGESLIVPVKTLLGNSSSSEPLSGGADVTGSFPSILSKVSTTRSEAGGKRGSDDSSSGDSLTACVKNLLRKGLQGVHDTQLVKSGDEEEGKARAWMKLKLASQSEASLSELNEGKQERIEEIKAELLWRATNSASPKEPEVRALEAASGYSHDQELDVNSFKTPSDRRFQSDNQIPTIRTKELVESSLHQSEPLRRAGLSDCCLQFKTSSTVQTPVCNQHQTVPTSLSDVVELHPSVQKEWDTFAMRSASASNIATESYLSARKKLSMENCYEDVVKQITSITFSSRKRLRSPLTSVALGSSLTGDDLDGIMPLEVDSASAEEQSHDKQRLERSKTCLPSPVLAGLGTDEIVYAGEKDGFHPLSVDSSRIGAYQGTDCLSDQHSVSIHADKRQTLSAKHSDVSPQDVTELGKRSTRLTGLDCDTIFSQETNQFNESRAVSSYQQEKSSPRGHVQLCANLEGSGPAVRSDLLKGPVKVLEEEKESPPHEVAPVQKETVREQIHTSRHASTGGILSTESASPSPRTKKVLSCVHITLSSKGDDSELQSDAKTETEMGSRDIDVNTQPVPSKTLEALTTVSKLSPADLVPEEQRSLSFPVAVSSAGPCPVLSSLTGTAGQELPLQSSERSQGPVPGSSGFNLNDIFNSVVPTNTGKSTSDAATQITTESPGKTTFSAEIYVNSHSGENAAQQSSRQKAREVPSIPVSSLNKIPSFPRQDQPLLLPYKPSGSAEMYYVPYLKAGAKPSSLGWQTSGESSHSGPNDALPPRALESVLGLRNDDPRGSAAVEYKEGNYSKRAKPKLAWAEEQMRPLEAFPEHTDHSKSVKNTHLVFKSARFYLHQPVPRCESFFGSNSEQSEDGSDIGHTRPSSRALLPNWKTTHRHQRVFSVHHKKDGENEFFPLTAEADYSRNEDLDVSTSLRNETPGKEHGRREVEERTNSYCLPRSQTTHLNEKMEKDLPPRQRSRSSSSLDELWIKFLECQKRHQQHDFRRNGELSLVERLDRLARVLQNPIKHTLMPPKSEMNVSEEKRKGREQKKIRLAEKSMSESTFKPNATHVEGRPHITHKKNSFVELRKNRSGEKALYRMNKGLEHQQCFETPSETSSETRLSRDHGTTMSSTISESDSAAPTELGTATPTEVSSSVSTIDTARLIRAFGHERVQVAPRLSQLYETINRQKTRSEEWDKASGRAGGVEYLKVASERHKKRNEIQRAISISSDSTSTSSSSWGPSSALTTKRRTRMLNKGIQAGDLEIVNSATKKNTRDVGMTFPTPRPNQPNQRPQEPWHRIDGIPGKSDGVVTDHRAAGSKGISWFVQAEHGKSESHKENQIKSFSGPGPSWFEPLTSTKLWREPLREKNWQDQQLRNMVQRAVPQRDAEKRTLQPFVRLTLQEALAVHRPDFISRSGERVKHLKLVMEERKMQSVLQAEREELFNPPEKRKGYMNANHVLSNRGLLIKEKGRTIPKSEMVQRSKRIYEQLPEVQKKREEEKRRKEYNSNRLKAQLYKAKITNQVLGRKVPWN
ncbi:centrosome-associated protein ALMS1 [Phaenicophaeus curvirostris]|uniref:centrosome-associated protein ALMS1 n=1 Tax=Phaenicophaeus curvirostris TaxID=33595 RepID=UPI0037F0D05E